MSTSSICGLADAARICAQEAWVIERAPLRQRILVGVPIAAIGGALAVYPVRSVGALPEILPPVKDALNSLASLRDPGPDGLPMNEPRLVQSIREEQVAGGRKDLTLVGRADLYFKGYSNRLRLRGSEAAASTKSASRRTTNRIAAIPAFSNVLLDYETAGDFNRYLQRVEIREHPIALRTRQGGRRVNDHVWRALFIFSRNRHHGRLKVKYN
jgi:hypothetical protein